MAISLAALTDSAPTDHVRAAHRYNRESSRALIAADDGIAVEHVAGHLDVEVVLVGPEPGRVVILFGLVDHVGGNRNRLVLGVGPGLDPDRAAVAVAPLQGGLARAEHAGCRGAAAGIDGHPA